MLLYINYIWMAWMSGWHGSICAASNSISMWNSCCICCTRIPVSLCVAPCGPLGSISNIFYCKSCTQRHSLWIYQTCPDVIDVRGETDCFCAWTVPDNMDNILAFCRVFHGATLSLLQNGIPRRTNKWNPFLSVEFSSDVDCGAESNSNIGGIVSSKFCTVKELKQKQTKKIFTSLCKRPIMMSFTFSTVCVHMIQQILSYNKLFIAVRTPIIPAN